MKKLLLALILPLFLAVLMPDRAYADLQDFTINNFEAEYTLSNEDKQGTLNIVENIQLTFSDNNHGILRAIPSSYKGQPLQLKVNSISSPSGAPSEYTTSNESGNTVLKIGDPARTVTGPQQYRIDYTVNNVISFYGDHDELYWDINGDQWQQPFEKVSLVLNMPDGVVLSNEKPLCFAGAFGKNDTDACEIAVDGNWVMASTLKPLTPRQTMTVVIGVQKGYFTAPTFADKLLDYALTIIKITLLPLIVFVYSFRRWRKFGRDPKGRGTIVPEYEAPDNLRPMEVGSLLDFKADNKDLTATIIDLAVRGHIRIIETKKDKLIGKDKLEYGFELLNKAEDELLAYEKLVLTGMRSAGKASEDTAGKDATITVELKDMKNKFYTTAAKVTKEVEKDMVSKGYFPSKPSSAGTRLAIIGGLCGGLVFMAGGALGAAVVVSLILSAVIAFIFAVLMSSRTVKGVEALDKARGLKLYLNTAEKDRIAMLQAPNAKYAANHNAPKKTVELFEKLLPYAMILGVEKQWAKEFEGIYNEPPNWYSGNWAAFNTGLLIGSLNNSVGAMNSVAFSSPNSSGGSGMGGGGFSGGGGGGGGGGGW